MSHILDFNESVSMQTIESIINTNENSISTIRIPLISYQPILAASPSHILINEHKNKMHKMILIDANIKKYPTRISIVQSLIDALWHSIERKFLLLTERKIFSFNPVTKLIESLSDIKPTDRKVFKCFTTFNNQPLLFIAYDEWGPAHIDEWQKHDENEQWTLIKTHSLNCTQNEFIGTMLGINQDGCSSLAMTIYNDFTQQWRLEVRNTTNWMCVRTILLPRSNFANDYRMVEMYNVEYDIKWLIYSINSCRIIGVDTKWNQIPFTYKSPVIRIIQFTSDKLIIRTKKYIDIYGTFS